MPNETKPQLLRSEYRNKVDTLAKRALHQLADDETGEVAYEADDIQPLISETDDFYKKYPHTVNSYAHCGVYSDTWSWISDAPPVEGLQRQALHVMSQDVACLLDEYIESGEYTYVQNGTMFLRESFKADPEAVIEQENKGFTHLVAETDFQGGPKDGTEESEQLELAIRDVIKEILYEAGYVGHNTNVTMEVER